MKGAAEITHASCGEGTVPSQSKAELHEILLEQLEYLMLYAEQEQDRLRRVAAILMETFQ